MKKTIQYSKLKKVATFSVALMVSTTLLSGCGSDDEATQQPSSDDTVIINNDSSFSDFLAGTIIGNWLGSSNNSNFNTTNSRPTPQNINNTTKNNKEKLTTDDSKVDKKTSEKNSQNGAKNITIPNKNVSNIGNKSSISSGKTGIGSTGGRSSAS